jgi:hypothetical protein
MPLYVYMFIQIALSYTFVGIFFGILSIFIRDAIPTDECISHTTVPDLIENFYLGFLLFILTLSITVEVTWAEFGFRI